MPHCDNDETGKMHCVIDILTIGEQVRTRRNLAHWGSWDTVNTDTSHRYTFVRVTVALPILRCQVLETA